MMTAQAYIDEKLKLWNVEYPTALLVAEMQRVGLGISDEFNEENERKTKLFFYNIMMSLQLFYHKILTVPFRKFQGQLKI